MFSVQAFRNCRPISSYFMQIKFNLVVLGVLSVSKCLMHAIFHALTTPPMWEIEQTTDENRTRPHMPYGMLNTYWPTVYCILVVYVWIGLLEIKHKFSLYSICLWAVCEQSTSIAHCTYNVSTFQTFLKFITHVLLYGWWYFLYLNYTNRSSLECDSWINSLKSKINRVAKPLELFESPTTTRKRVKFVPLLLLYCQIPGRN